MGSGVGWGECGEGEGEGALGVGSWSHGVGHPNREHGRDAPPHLPCTRCTRQSATLLSHAFPFTRPPHHVTPLPFLPSIPRPPSFRCSHHTPPSLTPSLPLSLLCLYPFHFYSLPKSPLWGRILRLRGTMGNRCSVGGNPSTQSPKRLSHALANASALQVLVCAKSLCVAHLWEIVHSCPWCKASSLSPSHARCCCRSCYLCFARTIG